MELGNAQFSSRVKVVVDLYGPTDLLRIEEQKLPCIPLDGNAPNMPPSLLMGCPIQECKEKTATANPITYVKPDDPPFLIMHGTEDSLVPLAQSRTLAEALTLAGAEAELIAVPGAEHGWFGTDDTGPLVARVLEFAARLLPAGTPSDTPSRTPSGEKR